MVNKIYPWICENVYTKPRRRKLKIYAIFLRVFFYILVLLTLCYVRHNKNERRKNVVISGAKKWTIFFLLLIHSSTFLSSIFHLFIFIIFLLLSATCVCAVALISDAFSHAFHFFSFLLLLFFACVDSHCFIANVSVSIGVDIHITRVYRLFFVRFFPHLLSKSTKNLLFHCGSRLLKISTLFGSIFEYFPSNRYLMWLCTGPKNSFIFEIPNHKKSKYTQRARRILVCN